MKRALVVAVCQTLALAATRIILSNDDGWAELQARDLYKSLTMMGHDVVLSSPTKDMSDAGSKDKKPKALSENCHHKSCPDGAGKPSSHAYDSTRLNWVNGYPVTAMRYGILKFGPREWNGSHPELAVTGVNVGEITHHAVNTSGHVAAATYATTEYGIPSIAFAADADDELPWDTLKGRQPSAVYAEVAANLTQIIIAAGAPYLPSNTFLNVNMPRSEKGRCEKLDDFQFVYSRIRDTWDDPLPRGLEVCGTGILPREMAVIRKWDKCLVSVSLGDATTRGELGDLEKHMVVLEKLRPHLSCDWWS